MDRKLLIAAWLLALSGRAYAECDPFSPSDALKQVTDGMSIKEIAAVIDRIMPREVRLAEGGSSGGGTGGGSGIACFTDEASAFSAQDAWKKGEPISDEALARISSLQITDLWERNNDEIAVPKSLAGGELETASQYLDRVLKQDLASVSPSLLAKITNALSRVDLENSKITQSDAPVLPIHDTSIADPKAKCAQVQIAKRHSRVDPDGKLVVERIELDPRLYSKLGMTDGKIVPVLRVQNQAALRLHEALYLIAFGLGSRNSDGSRLLTSQLLLQADLNSDQKSRTLVLVRSMYTSGFNDFVFVEQTPGALEKRAIRDAMAKVQDKMAASGQVSRDSYVQSLVKQEKQKIELYPLLTEVVRGGSDIEAFVLASQGAVEMGESADFFAMIDPSSDDSEIRRSCDYIRDIDACHKSRFCSGRGLFNSSETTPEQSLRDAVYDKARKYCEGRGRK